MGPLAMNTQTGTVVVKNDSDAESLNRLLLESETISVGGGEVVTQLV
jgi:hypothetical protein